MVRYPKIVLTGHFKMIWNEKRAFRTPPDATWPCGHLVELSVWRLIRSNHAQPGRFYAKPHPNLAQYLCATRINARLLIPVRSRAAPKPSLSAATYPDCAPRRAPE